MLRPDVKGQYDCPNSWCGNEAPVAGRMQWPLLHGRMWCVGAGEHARAVALRARLVLEVPERLRGDTFESDTKWLGPAPDSGIIYEHYPRFWALRNPRALWPGTGIRNSDRHVFLNTIL